MIIYRDKLIHHQAHIIKCFLSSKHLITYELVDEDGVGKTQKKIGDEVIWQIDENIFIFILHNGHLFYRHEIPNIFIAHDDQTGTQVWSKSLPEKLLRIIGVCNELIWIVLNSGRIIGLNLHTGEEKVTLLQPNSYPSSWDNRISDPTFFLGEYAQLDVQQNKLFGLRGWFYWEIDLTNPAQSYTLYDLENHFKSFQMEANMPGYNLQFDSNRIFFGSIDRKGPTIGAIDRSTRQIIWTSGEANSDTFLPSVRQMVYQSPRLYVLDGNDTLHIFEE